MQTIAQEIIKGALIGLPVGMATSVFLFWWFDRPVTRQWRCSGCGEVQMPSDRKIWGDDRMAYCAECVPEDFS